MIISLNIVAAATGSAKIEALRSQPELKHILKAAYNPFQKYYLTLSGIKGCGNVKLKHKIPALLRLLGALSKRELSGKTAVDTCSKMIKQCTPEDAITFQRILNKDLRIGINVKTINKAFPGLIPLVFDASNKPDLMLLKNFSDTKVKYPVMVAKKEDGVRARFVGGVLISRQGHEFTGLSHIEEQLKNFNCEFDGELCVPGEIFDTASGMIRSDNNTPTAVYHIFDVPSHQGTKSERWEYLNEIKTAGMTVIPHFWAKNKSELDTFYKHILKKGGEGIVIYDPESTYEDKRSYDWVRMVPTPTIDCKVIGFFEGKGKHADSLGGVVVDFNGKSVKVGTGFKEKFEDNHSIVRSYIWNHQAQFLGKIAEVGYKEKTKSGSLRHPKFKCWRGDKDAD